jgi:hypothetical protein
MTDLHARRLKALAVQIAMDDPEVVLELIRQLEMAGDIEPGELRHVESIARHWREINQGNLKKARR